MASTTLVFSLPATLSPQSVKQWLHDRPGWHAAPAEKLTTICYDSFDWRLCAAGTLLTTEQPANKVPQAPGVAGRGREVPEAPPVRGGGRAVATTPGVRSGGRQVPTAPGVAGRTRPGLTAPPVEERNGPIECRGPTPAHGVVGSLFTLHGRGFGDSVSGVRVSVAGIAAAIRRINDRRLQIEVPPGTGEGGPVIVRIGRQAGHCGSFEVRPGIRPRDAHFPGRPDGR